MITIHKFHNFILIFTTPINFKVFIMAWKCTIFIDKSIFNNNYQSDTILACKTLIYYRLLLLLCVCMCVFLSVCLSIRPSVWACVIFLVGLFMPRCIYRILFSESLYLIKMRRCFAARVFVHVSSCVWTQCVCITWTQWGGFHIGHQTSMISERYLYLSLRILHSRPPSLSPLAPLPLSSTSTSPPCLLNLPSLLHLHLPSLSPPHPPPLPLSTSTSPPI